MILPNPPKPVQKPSGTSKTLQIIESLESGEHKVYNTIFVDPQNIDIISNDLAMKIVSQLSVAKGCAMDLSRELKQHEQKIYYHLRRLEQAGIIKRIGSERRFGMIAKMYTTSSPIVSLKLYDDGYVVDKKKNVNELMANSLLYPFIKNGELNAKIVVGDTYSHGRFDAIATESAHIVDFLLMLGKNVSQLKYPTYRLDIEVSQDELKENNLILVGNARTNMIIDKVNSSLPIFFDVDKGWHIQSKSTNNSYEDPRVGLILKLDSPFNPEKKMLLIGGVRTRGTQAAVIAFTKHMDKLIKLQSNEGNIGVIVQGLDKDGDKILDDIKFLEPGEQEPIEEQPRENS